MAFEIVSIADIKNQHYYYFVDRFTISTNVRLYKAFFNTQNDEEEPEAVLEIPEDIHPFRLKVHVQNYGSYIFFFEKDAFNKTKDKVFEEIKKLKNLTDPDEKVGQLLKIVCKDKPLLAAFYDERDEEFNYLEFRKPFLREHIYCKVFVFRKINIEGALKADKKSSFKEDIKLIAEAAKKTGRGIKKATFAIGRFFKAVGKGAVKAGRGIGKATKWTYRKILTPIGRAIKKVSKAIWKCLKFVFVPLGRLIWKGIKFVGKGIKKLCILIAKGISKIFPHLLPFLGKVFRKIGKAIAIVAVFIWKGIKKLSIFLGRFCVAFACVLWALIKILGKYLWKLLKFLGKLLWKFIKLLGRLLRKFFGWFVKILKKGIKNLPKYVEWKGDYTFYIIFSLLFAFALMCGIVWSLNDDGLSIFFFAMTALFMLICVYATYIQRNDHHDWSINIKNILAPNLAIFLGLLVGVISSYFTSKAIIKVPDGKELDFGLALWITIGASFFLLIALNFTPFIIHKINEGKKKENDNNTQKEPAKSEQNQEIAGESQNENEYHKE